MSATLSQTFLMFYLGSRQNFDIWLWTLRICVWFVHTEHQSIIIQSTWQSNVSINLPPVFPFSFHGDLSSLSTREEKVLEWTGGSVLSNWKELKKKKGAQATKPVWNWVNVYNLQRTKKRMSLVPKFLLKTPSELIKQGDVLLYCGKMASQNHWTLLFHWVNNF